MFIFDVLFYFKTKKLTSLFGKHYTYIAHIIAHHLSKFYEVKLFGWKTYQSIVSEIL